MKKFYKEAKFIFLFFLVLSALTFLSLIDFENEKISVHKPFEMLNAQELASKTFSRREPAAVSGKDSLVLNKNFFCSHSELIKQDQVPSKMVMLNFKMCDEVKSAKNVLIENTSNGFKAQIFKIEENSFKTDYIQLSEGLNKLKLEIILKDGQKRVESLEILSGS